MNTAIYSIRLETLGCKLNQAESESFAALCMQAGFSIYTVPKDNSDADNVLLCFINTCTVTGKAEQKARRLIRLLIRQHPHAALLVTGCYAQLEAAALKALHPHIIVFPGQQKDLLIHLPQFLSTCAQNYHELERNVLIEQVRAYCLQLQTPVHPRQIKNAQTELFTLSSSHFLFHSRALIKIQDGCNNACAYCRIRLARGKSVSLEAAEVLARIRRIENGGISEVTLTGVNLSQYKSSIGDFADLLKFLLNNTTIRIRISSLYPERIDDALVPLLAHPNICPHFHLSVQSGSNTILRAMHRAYSQETVYEAVAKLRTAQHNPFIGVDIITGFPGETEKDFAETYQMCKDLQFAGIHAFPFSARPGTEAWFMQPKVPERIAGERVKQLSLLSKQHETAYYAQWHGSTVYGVIECTNNKQFTVTTENYLSLPAEYSGILTGGEYVQVLITEHTAKILRCIRRKSTTPSGGLLAF